MTGWTAALVVCSAFLVGALLPPIVGEEVRQLVMAVYSTICHQIPGRSPFVDGVQLSACHRCLGIFTALAAAPVAFLFLRQWDGVINRSARWLVLASILVPGADWFFDIVGWWTNTPVSRGLTGSIFGITAGYFLTRALVELSGGMSESTDALSPSAEAAPGR